MNCKVLGLVYDDDVVEARELINEVYNMRVYIVIEPDLGWDNIIGIFENSIDAVRCKSQHPGSFIVENYVESEYKSE